MSAWRKPLALAPSRLLPSSPPQARSSQTAANRWRDGRSITRSCTLGRPLSPTPPSRTPPYPPWKSLTHHLQWARHRDAANRTTNSALQGCLQAWKTCNISPGNLESATADRTLWRSTVKAGVKQAELKRESQWEVKRTRRRQRLQSAPIPPTPTNDFTCTKCQRVCGSRIGLHSHSRQCSWHDFTS